jgi:hypothetical protein
MGMDSGKKAGRAALQQKQTEILALQPMARRPEGKATQMM